MSSLVAHGFSSNDIIITANTMRFVHPFGVSASSVSRVTSSPMTGGFILTWPQFGARWPATHWREEGKMGEEEEGRWGEGAEKEELT